MELNRLVSGVPCLDPEKPSSVPFLGHSANFFPPGRDHDAQEFRATAFHATEAKQWGRASPAGYLPVLQLLKAGRALPERKKGGQSYENSNMIWAL